MVNMNMIFNGPGISANGTKDKDNLSADTSALGKMIKAWETKQRTAKKLGGFGLLAVTLAACNDDGDSSGGSAAVDATPYDDAYVAAQVAAATAAAEAAAATAAAEAAALATAAADAAAADAAAAATTQAAYDALVAPKSLVLTNATVADNLSGGAGDDTITGGAGTLAAGDVIRDQSTTDNDTLTILDEDGTAGAFTAQNVENINLNYNALGAVGQDAVNFSGVENLTITRADVTVGGSVLNGSKGISVTNLDAADVAKVTAGAGTTTAAITQVNTAGIVADLDAASGDLTLVGPMTVNAAGMGVGDTLTMTGMAVAGTTTAAQEAVANAQPVNITTNAATVTLANGAGTAPIGNIDGVISITAPLASAVTVPAGGGGVTVNAAGGAAGGIDVRLLDASGATITTTYAGTTTAPGVIDLDFVGTAGIVDTATVKALGSVNLDVGVASNSVDALVLEGNGGAVTYTVTASNDAANIASISGTSDVTISVDEALVTAKVISGGPNVIVSGTAGTFSAATWTAGTISIGFNNAGNAITAGTAQSWQLTSATQTGLDFEFAAANTDGSITLTSGDVNGATNSTVGTASVGALNLVSAQTTTGTVNIIANDSNFTATGTTAVALTDIIITGDENVNLGTVTTSNSINAQGSTGIITATLGAASKSILTGTGADAITLNGNRIHIVDGGAGIDNIVVTSTAPSSSIAGGAGADTFTLTDVDRYVVVGGDGNDNVTVNGSLAATVVGGDGTDILTFPAGATDLAANFSTSSFESVNISLAGATVSFTDLEFAGLESAVLTGNAATDVLAITVGAAATGRTLDNSNFTKATGSTSTINYITGSTGADVITGGTAAENFVMNEMRGADSIEGGGGALVDVLSSNNITIQDLRGTATSTATSTGMVINMGSTTVTGVNVLSNVGDHLAGGISSVAAGSMAYIYNLVDTATPGNSNVISTVSGIENVTITDTNAVNYIVGNDSNNTITVSGQNDYLEGGAGDDIINAGAGNDIVNGGDGADTINGQAGNDTVNGGNGADIITTTTGADIINGGAGDDVILGGAAIDTINGGADNDTIGGEDGADIIDGGAGNDIITGGLAADIITSGTGADVLILDGGLTADSMTDFVSGAAATTDTIHLKMAAGLEGANLVKATTTVNLVEPQGAGDIIAGDIISIQEIAPNSTTTATALTANANIFVLLTTTYANATAVKVALETGTHEVKVHINVTADDGFIVAYSDGTNAKLAIVNVEINPSTNLATNDLVVLDLVTLNANAALNAGELVITDFVFV
jgi:Ca2+-binding RTX toxin-like protein